MLHIESVFFSSKTFIGLLLFVHFLIPHTMATFACFLHVRTVKKLWDIKLNHISSLIPRCWTVKCRIRFPWEPQWKEKTDVDLVISGQHWRMNRKASLSQKTTLREARKCWSACLGASLVKWMFYEDFCIARIKVGNNSKETGFGHERTCMSCYRQICLSTTYWVGVSTPYWLSE